MSAALTTTLDLNLTANLASTLDLGTSASNESKRVYKKLTDGTGIDQSQIVFSDNRTLANATSENLDLFDFVGALDSLGRTYAQLKIVAILIVNKSIIAGDNLKVGGEGSAAAWNSLFDASDTAKAIVGPGGCLFAFNPSVAAFAVTDASNHLLKIDNPGANSINYDIMVIGRTA